MAQDNKKTGPVIVKKQDRSGVFRESVRPTQDGGDRIKAHVPAVTDTLKPPTVPVAGKGKK